VTVYVVGGTTFDLLISGLPRFATADPAGDEFTSRSLVDAPAPTATIGGNGGNAAYALARLGCRVHLFTALGGDPFGEAASAWLTGVGCEVDTLLPRETSVNVVLTDRAGHRLSYFHPVGIDAAAAATLVDQLPCGPGDHLLLAGYPHPDDDLLRRLAEKARAAGSTVWLDIGPALAGFTRVRLADLIPVVDVLLCNRDELAATDPGADADRLADEFAHQLAGGLVVKAGAAGATFHGRREQVTVPAVPISATASVGAGDVFNGAFIRAAHDAGTDMRDRLRYAAAAAALMLERGDGVLGSPTHDDVTAFLSRQSDVRERTPR
jgi:sugar/nucleoside kinase (ribokinase family)